MSKQIEFFFDFGSPTTYLAWTQLPRIAAAHGASIAWRPMLLGGVFKATGNHSPIEVPAKGRYTLHDLARYAKRYGVPLAFNPAFPINTLTLMRGAQGYLGGEGFHPVPSLPESGVRSVVGTTAEPRQARGGRPGVGGGRVRSG